MVDASGLVVERASRAYSWILVDTAWEQDNITSTNNEAINLAGQVKVNIESTIYTLRKEQERKENCT
jgi:hypothetical protein